MDDGRLPLGAAGSYAIIKINGLANCRYGYAMSTAPETIPLLILLFYSIVIIVRIFGNGK